MNSCLNCGVEIGLNKEYCMDCNLFDYMLESQIAYDTGDMEDLKDLSNMDFNNGL